MENKEEGPSSNFDPYLLMEDTLEILKLLDYENHFVNKKGHRPLSRTFFVEKSTNTNEQFVYFSSLAMWLLSMCGGQISGDKKYDDPVTMANNLLTEMKNIGIETDIPPNKLRTGYGEYTCLVLSKLVSKAFEKKKISLKKLRPENEKIDNAGDGVLDIEDENPDLINQEIDFGDQGGETTKKPADEEETEEEESNILYTEVSPEEWQRETERVASKLKMDFGALNLHSTEWRNHIDQIKIHEQNFSKSIPNSRAILEHLSADIDQSLDKISKKEGVVSKNYSNIISDFKSRQKETKQQMDEYTTLKDTVEALQREYEEIEEKAIEANNKFESISNSISDTSVLNNIKQTIQKLTSEGTSIDIKIHILNHSILKNKLQGLQDQGSADLVDNDIFDEVL